MSEEPEFVVVQELADDIEIRDYASYLSATTTVPGDRDQASQNGFEILAAFIKGANDQEKKIAMTSPVTLDDTVAANLEDDGHHLSRTGALSHTDAGEHEMAFMMPRQFTMETVPKPTDPRVALVQVPARRIAAITYRGRWTEELYNEKLSMLRNALEGAGIMVKTSPAWARYNSPMMPFFLRHNEIWLEIDRADQG